MRKNKVYPCKLVDVSDPFLKYQISFGKFIVALSASIDSMFCVQVRKVLSQEARCVT